MGTTGHPAAARPAATRVAERELLVALGAYAAADADSQRRIRESLGINATDVRALEIIGDAAVDGGSISPRDLSRALAISTASTSAVLERLTAGRHIERRAHPTDGRAQLLAVAPRTAAALDAANRDAHERLRTAADRFSDDELRTAATVVDTLAGALADDGE